MYWYVWPTHSLVLHSFLRRRELLRRNECRYRFTCSYTSHLLSILFLLHDHVLCTSRVIHSITIYRTYCFTRAIETLSPTVRECRSSVKHHYRHTKDEEVNEGKLFDRFFKTLSLIAWSEIVDQAEHKCKTRFSVISRVSLGASQSAFCR